MSLPFNPEPLVALQARYPRALEVVYDQQEIAERGGIRPGQVPANIFDFDDGLKLIVSRERDLDDDAILHLCASFLSVRRIADEFRLLTLTRSTESVFAEWLRDVPHRFRELSNDSRPIRFLGCSENGVPHWIIPATPGE